MESTAGTMRPSTTTKDSRLTVRSGVITTDVPATPKTCEGEVERMHIEPGYCVKCYPKQIQMFWGFLDHTFSQPIIYCPSCGYWFKVKYNIA